MIVRMCYNNFAHFVLRKINLGLGLIGIAYKIPQQSLPNTGIRLIMIINIHYFWPVNIIILTTAGLDSSSNC